MDETPRPMQEDEGTPAGSGCRLIAYFTPEAWVRDCAVETDPEGQPWWDCTAYARTMPDYLDEIARAQEGGLDSADGALDIHGRFKDDPAAPEWIRRHSGPFTIRAARRRPGHPGQEPVPAIDVSCVVPVIDRAQYAAGELAARLGKLGEPAAAAIAGRIARREIPGTVQEAGGAAAPLRELADACERQAGALGLGNLGLDDALDARDFLVRVEDPPEE